MIIKRWLKLGTMCLVGLVLTACQVGEEGEEQINVAVATTSPMIEVKNNTDSAWYQNGTEIIVQGEKSSSNMDFDTDSMDVIGVVPWYVNSKTAEKLIIKKDVHLKWKEADLENEVSNYSSNLAGCPSLKVVEVEEGNETLFSKNGLLFKYSSKNEKGLYACPVKRSGVLEIPADTNQIWACAFNGCSEISEVLIPETVSGIGDAAFGNMKKCTKITVSKDSPYFESEDGVLYTKGKKVLLAYPSGKSKVSERYDNTWKNWRKEMGMDYQKSDKKWITGYRGLGI